MSNEKIMVKDILGPSYLTIEIDTTPFEDGVSKYDLQVLCDAIYCSLKMLYMKYAGYYKNEEVLDFLVFVNSRVDVLSKEIFSEVVLGDAVFCNGRFNEIMHDINNANKIIDILRVHGNEED